MVDRRLGSVSRQEGDREAHENVAQMMIHHGHLVLLIVVIVIAVIVTAVAVTVVAVIVVTISSGIPIVGTSLQNCHL
jgi:uncharacterized membrane protein